MSFLPAGRLDEAIENYRKALEIDLASAVVYLRLGQALRLQGADQANENYAEVTIAGSKLSYAYFEWGRALRNPKVSWMKLLIEKYQKVVGAGSVPPFSTQVLGRHAQTTRQIECKVENKACKASEVVIRLFRK